MKQKSFSFKTDNQDILSRKNLSNIGSFLVSYPKLNEHYFASGNFSLIKSLRLEVVSEIDQAQVLWQEFSSFQTLFDTFEFRLAFFKASALSLV